MPWKPGVDWCCLSGCFGGYRKLDPHNVGKIEGLPVAILEDDHDGAWAAFGGRGRPGKTTWNRETQHCGQASNADELTHGILLGNQQPDGDLCWAAPISSTRPTCQLFPGIHAG